MKKTLNIFVLFLFLILISFDSYGGWFDNTVCVETDAQIRSGIIYLLNETKPFTGKNSCEWNEDGQVNSKGEVKDGKKEGKWTFWNENGQKKAEGNFKDGKQDGKWTYWFENGQIWWEGNYKDGKRNGKQTRWFENGQIEAQENYKDGKLQ